MSWPKRPTWWTEGNTVCCSVPFTWNLPEVRAVLQRPFPHADHVLVGGPAVQLMPEYLMDLPGITLGGDLPGVLQRVNRHATRTTTGCIRRCGFCGIGRGSIEPGGLHELEDWPNRPILADNNLLAASVAHFDRVLDRLAHFEWADFTQGLDARLLTDHHAKRLARLRGPRTVIRLALDALAETDAWENAFGRLRTAGVPLAHIRSYALIGFDSDPSEAWRRCEWVEAHKIKVLPMWFHPLDALQCNVVTPNQQSMGWTDTERRRIMQWYYKHRGSKPQAVAA